MSEAFAGRRWPSTFSFLCLSPLLPCLFNLKYFSYTLVDKLHSSYMFGYCMPQKPPNSNTEWKEENGTSGTVVQNLLGPGGQVISILSDYKASRTAVACGTCCWQKLSRFLFCLSTAWFAHPNLFRLVISLLKGGGGELSQAKTKM